MFWETKLKNVRYFTYTNKWGGGVVGLNFTYYFIIKILTDTLIPVVLTRYEILLQRFNFI
jgi:hypothetical protein